MTSIPARVREFVEVLKEMEGGDVHYDLTEGLTNLIHAVLETRKQGSITLVMNIAPTGKGTVTMATDVKIREPKHDRPHTTFFVDDKFQLHRDDPRQEKMDLRTPAEHNQDLRGVPEDTTGLRVVSGDE